MFGFWEQEVPGGGSHRAQERAAFGVNAPDGAANANRAAPISSKLSGRRRGRAGYCTRVKSGGVQVPSSASSFGQ